MSRSFLTGFLVLGLAACAGAAAKDAPTPDALQPNTQTGVSSRTRSSAATSDQSRRVEPTGRTLASGTTVYATVESALSSRTNKPGETLRASVSRDISDDRGRVVIPAGSIVTLSIVQLEPGSDQVRPEGRLVLEVNSVTVHGQTHSVTADLAPVTHHLQGRGITTDEAARVGAGTAIGAVAGQLIGKDTRSTTIGGAIGAVAGGAVAVRYAYRDVIVSAGTPIAFTLTQSLNISAR
jgi:hypothetical protein